MTDFQTQSTMNALQVSPLAAEKSFQQFEDPNQGYDTRATDTLSTNQDSNKFWMKKPTNNKVQASREVFGRLDSTGGSKTGSAKNSTNSITLTKTVTTAKTVRKSGQQVQQLFDKNITPPTQNFQKKTPSIIEHGEFPPAIQVESY